MGVFIIAEAGSNWRVGSPERDLQLARTLIDAAAEAGADAVKFQTYRAETTYVANAGESAYLSEAGITKPINEIFDDLAMPPGMVPLLAEHCAARNIEFMTTPFSVEEAALVDPYAKRHKLASYEITHIRLIEFLASIGKPLLMSTGAATLDDIEWAVSHFRERGGKDLTLLQCTAKYPAPIESLNLRALVDLKDRFGLPTGLSDHSRDPIAGPVAAAALGATVIEKHFTLHNALPGPDHAFAVTPDELAAMVRAVRDAEKALGSGGKAPLPVETELRDYAQRGIQAIAGIAEGESFREGVNIGILRPGQQPKGMHPRHLPEIEGREAARAIRPGEGVRKGDVR